jgi:hypothetical protein
LVGGGENFQESTGGVHPIGRPTRALADPLQTSASRVLDGKVGLLIGCQGIVNVQVEAKLAIGPSVPAAHLQLATVYILVVASWAVDCIVVDVLAAVPHHGEGGHGSIKVSDRSPYSPGHGRHPCGELGCTSEAAEDDNEELQVRPRKAKTSSSGSAVRSRPRCSATVKIA